ncbi:hypothetical protein M8J76_014956 [Diaphorina citri]|jgi:hypothetical protein|nr:hypothetical protein M8J75_008292 [Diaphorina citri]KAI5722866.1 hypothetical protein M8J76_014956 [Diaphorina citri]
MNSEIETRTAPPAHSREGGEKKLNSRARNQIKRFEANRNKSNSIWEAKMAATMKSDLDPLNLENELIEKFGSYST